MLSEKLDRLSGYATVAPGTLFGRIACNLASTMLKVRAAQSAIAPIVLLHLLHLADAREKRTQARCSPVECLLFKQSTIKIKGIDYRQRMV
jgi:hypothetical protein